MSHSANHWNTETSMLEYLDCIIIPYTCIVETNGVDLPEDQPALTIFDVVTAHRYKSVLENLQSNIIHQVFVHVPAGCTGELQPLDVGINDKFKTRMKNSFTTWHANEVKEVTDRRVTISEILIHLKPS